MIPARTQCPDGWIVEYTGYLVSDRNNHTRSSYVCIDEAPETATGFTAQHQAMRYTAMLGVRQCIVYLHWCIYGHLVTPGEGH